MLVNLTDVFTSEGKIVTKEAALEWENFENGGEIYQITDRSPVSMKFTNLEQGKVLAEVSVNLTLKLVCDRCLQEVEHAFVLNAVREVVSVDIASEDELEEQEGFMDGYSLDVDALIGNEMMTCWPMKVLCRPDCKGLCPVCGQNLNMGTCGCDTFVPDPRMAAIMDIFNANKEV